MERLFSPRRCRVTFSIALLIAFAIFSTGCLHRHRRVKVTHRAPRPAAPSAPIVQGEEGIASWYGRPFHGRHTASGEIYNMYDMTAAHRTLPFGTQVRVHNLENGRDTEVRINDRGPFVKGRIIDLSYTSAQSMGMPSTALVRLEILSTGSGAPGTISSAPGVFAVQVGAFKDRRNAERLKGLIEPRFGPVAIQGFDRGNGFFYRVRVGREASEEAARDLARDLRRANLATETFVIRLN